MPTILITEPVPPPLFNAIRAALPSEIALNAVESLSLDDFAPRAAAADILLVGHRRIDAPLLDLAPRVRFIQRLGSGYDNIDVAAVAARGIPAAYTPGANAIAVAEHTVALMLALIKRLVPAVEATRANRWAFAELTANGLGDIADSTVGLVGLGQIGRAVADRLAPFGPRLLYTKRQPLDPDAEARVGVRYAALDDLLATSTIVSLHVPATTENRRFIGERELKLIRQGALLINTARGDLVDEAALRRAIECGHLAGAGLDVLRREANGGNPFAHLPQVLVTPHVGGVSRGARKRILQMAVENIGRVLAGQSPLYLVPGPGEEGGHAATIDRATQQQANTDRP